MVSVYKNGLSRFLLHESAFFTKKEGVQTHPLSLFSESSGILVFSEDSVFSEFSECSELSGNSDITLTHCQGSVRPLKPCCCQDPS